MPKNMLHDILPRERSIREVPLPDRRHPAPLLDPEGILYEREEEPTFEESGSKPPAGRRLLLWGITAVFLLLLGAALSVSFSGATVTVTPKVERVTLDHEFTASRTEGAKLRFETLPVHESAETVIPADTRKKVAERAFGTIIVYNAFSDAPQRLIKNTRFETPSGLIYRIGSSVTIPGRTKKNGRTIPGSLETTVSADAPGTDYNIALSDFTVPGFRNDSARFAGFYARSKTPMAGGFDGTVTVPSDAAVELAQAGLRDELEKRIAEEKQSLVPPGYVLFSNAVVMEYEPLPTEERQKEMAAVKTRAKGALYLFRKEDIAKAIAAETQTAAAKEAAAVEIPDLAMLSFELTNAPTGDPAKAENIRFKLHGDVSIVSVFDEQKLKTALLGKPKATLAATLASFPTIEKADLVVRPFWKRSFPDDPDKVKVERAPAPERPKDGSGH